MSVQLQEFSKDIFDGQDIYPKKDSICSPSNYPIESSKLVWYSELATTSDSMLEENMGWRKEIETKIQSICGLVQFESTS